MGNKLDKEMRHSCAHIFHHHNLFLHSQTSRAIDKRNRSIAGIRHFDIHTPLHQKLVDKEYS